jgi:hypothetical protein
MTLACLHIRLQASSRRRNQEGGLMGVNRLTVNSPKMHTTPHSHIIISIYIFKYYKVSRRGEDAKNSC